MLCVDTRTGGTARGPCRPLVGPLPPRIPPPPPDTATATAGQPPRPGAPRVLTVEEHILVVDVSFGSVGQLLALPELSLLLPTVVLRDQLLLLYAEARHPIVTVTSRHRHITSRHVTLSSHYVTVLHRKPSALRNETAQTNPDQPPSAIPRRHSCSGSDAKT